MPEGMQRIIRDKSKPRLLSRALYSNRTWYSLSGPVWHIVHLAFPMFCCMPLGCPPMSSAITLDTMGIKLGFLATTIHQGWILIPFTLSLYTKSSLYRRHDALHRTCSDFHTTSLVILLIYSTDSNWSLSMNDSSISSSPYFFMVSYIILTWVICFCGGVPSPISFFKLLIYTNNTDLYTLFTGKHNVRHINIILCIPRYEPSDSHPRVASGAGLRSFCGDHWTILALARWDDSRSLISERTSGQISSPYVIFGIATDQYTLDKPVGGTGTCALPIPRVAYSTALPAPMRPSIACLADALSVHNFTPICLLDWTSLSGSPPISIFRKGWSSLPYITYTVLLQLNWYLHFCCTLVTYLATYSYMACTGLKEPRHLHALD